MYINRFIFRIYKWICNIVLWGSGYLSAIMTLGFVFDGINNEATIFNTAIVIPYLIILCILIAFLFLNNELERARLYDSFFGEDADGIMKVHVLSKATGIKEQKIINDLNFFVKFKLFKIDIVYDARYYTITLYQANVLKEHIYETLYCSNCGAMNRVRRGFINTCSFCLESFVEEGD